MNMKTKKTLITFVGMSTLLISMCVAFNNSNTTVNLISKNIEALARGEGGGSGQTLDCYKSLTNDDSSGVNPTHYTYCGTCDADLATAVSGKSTCTN